MSGPAWEKVAFDGFIAAHVGQGSLWLFDGMTGFTGF
jgi:hypothetical protein